MKVRFAVALVPTLFACRVPTGIPLLVPSVPERVLALSPGQVVPDGPDDPLTAWQTETAVEDWRSVLSVRCHVRDEAGRVVGDDGSCAWHRDVAPGTYRLSVEAICQPVRETSVAFAQSRDRKLPTRSIAMPAETRLMLAHDALALSWPAAARHSKDVIAGHTKLRGATATRKVMPAGTEIVVLRLWPSPDGGCALGVVRAPPASDLWLVPL